MSEQAPETGGGGFSFSKKYGPLPAWGWIALAAVGAGVWWYVRSRKAAAAAAAPAASSTDTSSTDYAGELSTIQSEVQQLQGAESTETGSASQGSGTGTPVLAGGGSGPPPRRKPPASPPPAFPVKAKAPPRSAPPGRITGPVRRPAGTPVRRPAGKAT